MDLPCQVRGVDTAIAQACHIERVRQVGGESQVPLLEGREDVLALRDIIVKIVVIIVGSI